MEPLISIIIPVYNAEKYLMECIESVICQTYRNLEILLIDDGSKDDSFKICDEYAQKDKRIKVVHKENGGVSSARNLGLDLANGEYITFVDSDDMVDKKYVECLYKEIEKNKSDLVFCGYGMYNGSKLKPIKEEIPQTLKVDFYSNSFIEFCCRILSRNNSIFASVWRVLYQKKIVAQIRFNENIKVSEDMVFILCALKNATTIASIEIPLYLYRVNEESVTHNYKYNFLKSQLALYDEIKEFCGYFENKKIKRYFEVFIAYLCYHSFSNEIKNRGNSLFKKNIETIKDSVLYSYFSLRNGLRTKGIKNKLKYIFVCFLVKVRLVG